MKLDKAYEPGKYETAIYKRWEDSGAFKADPTSEKEHYSISMPPPNETGTLHMGSALFLVLQDILVRHARQLGKDALWLPGTDHAALATNALVEKQLAEQGIDRHQLGREAIVAQVRDFAGANRGKMQAQMRAMGASCDWSRARYTLDDALNRCVNETFVKMYSDGLIYRGSRIVNWDPNLETTVSDDEVEYQEEQGAFYTLQYGPFQISTARPETKFGDKYVVMHPDDERYKQYQDGEQFEAEWINGKVTATVVKDEAVDPAFGTGVMTITPWHDRTDFEIAERHGLEKQQIIDFKGRLLPIAGEFAGQGIAEARPKIVAKLQAKGLLVKTDENYSHNIAKNSRGGGVIEPQIMLQWFVDVNRPAMDWKGQKRSLKEVMRAVVEDGDIEVIPKRFEKQYYHWIDNLRDWCVSRQIWWGHQIPVWYKDQEVFVGTQAPEGDGWRRDDDTLDTWFSSALWTWSTLVDPELAKDYSLSLDDILQRSLDFKTYHPTSVLETGWDILFFWVARMILATTYMTGEVPFKQVYLHGLVRTESGKKMSKSDPDSLVDPLDVIAEYGTDALRLALVSGVNAGQDQRLGVSKIVANRNFANKLWNIARYAEGVVGEQGGGEPVPKSAADHWILSRLMHAANGLADDLANYRFSEAYDRLYHFVWDDFADWYIESSKVTPNPRVLRKVLEATLKITHPVAPFITEVIWQNLDFKSGSLLANELWPLAPEFDREAAHQYNQGIIKLVREIRRIQSVLVERNQKLLFLDSKVVEGNKELISLLARIGEIEKVEKSRGLKLTDSPIIEAWLDVDPKTAKPKIEDKLSLAKKEQGILRARLDSPDYIEKAPKDLVEQTEKELRRVTHGLEQLQSILQNL